MSDIFVSFTKTDTPWAHWIAGELKAMGHAPRVHDWEIKGGENIIDWMEERLKTAEKVLSVVSTQYLQAPYSKLERDAALWRSAKKRPGLCLLVVVDRCEIPHVLDHVKRCELYGVREEEVARQRLREYLNGPMPPHEAPPFPGLPSRDTNPDPFPGNDFATTNIPFAAPFHFMGREDVLNEVDAALKRYAGRVAVIALVGMRGAGKSTVATAYADRHRREYRAIWWIRAENDTGMHADLAALGIRLGWAARDEEEKKEVPVAAILQRLAHEPEGILLIYDNAIDADKLKPYLPRSGSAHVLITSNAPAWRRVAEPIEIRLWPKNVGADYLLVRTGAESERTEAEALSEALGGLPLALEVAAAYCEHLDIRLAEFHRLFNQKGFELFGNQPSPPEFHDRLTVTKAFALAIAEAGKLHPGAEPLIQYAALLAAEPIPLFLLVEGRQWFSKPLASRLAGGGLDEALAALRTFALVDREEVPDECDPAITTPAIRLHRLVREISAATCVGRVLKSARRDLIKAMAAVYPTDDYLNLTTNWPRARRLDALAVALVGKDATLPPGAELEASVLMENLSSSRRVSPAAYAEVHALLNRALKIRESKLGPDNPGVAQILNKLALLSMAQGDLPAAQGFCESALAIREKALSPDNTDIAQSHLNLARVLFDREDIASARSHCNHALSIYEAALGSDHPDVATCLTILGKLAGGDRASAQPLFERAHDIYEKRLKDHPATAASLLNLAKGAEDHGELATALQLIKRALEMYKKTVGKDHCLVGYTLSRLATVLRSQGEVANARLILQDALAINAKALGPDHPECISVRQRLEALAEHGG